MMIDDLHVGCCIDSLVALHLIISDFSSKPNAESPKKASSMPQLQNHYHSSEIVDQLSNAMSEAETSLSTKARQFDVSLVERGGEFLFVDTKSDLTERQPIKVLEDGTKVMFYTRPINIDQNFFSIDRKVLDESSTWKALFKDPEGSKTKFAFTLYDSSVVFRVFMGLDFPALSASKSLSYIFVQYFNYFWKPSISFTYQVYVYRPTYR